MKKYLLFLTILGASYAAIAQEAPQASVADQKAPVAEQLKSLQKFFKNPPQDLTKLTTNIKKLDLLEETTEFGEISAFSLEDQATIKQFIDEIRKLEGDLPNQI